MNRRAIVGIALLAALVAAVLALLRWQSTDVDVAIAPTASSRDPIAGPAATAPAAASKAPSSPARSRVPVSVAAPIQPKLRLLDRLSRRALVDATVATRDGAVLGTTDHRGLLSPEGRDDDLATVGLLATLSEDLDGLEIPVDSERAQRGAEVQATAPVFARLEIRVRPTQSFSRPTAEACPVESAATDPFRWSTEDPAVGNRWPNPLDTLLMDVPFSGDVVVNVHAPKRIGWRRVLRVERGRTTTVEATLAPRPIVSGVLVDRDGNPIPNHSVSIFASSTHRDDQSYDLEWDDGSAWREPFSESVIYEKTMVTDSTGGFELRVPFTDDIRVFAYDISRDRGPAMAYLERKLGSATESATELRVALRPVERKTRVRILAPDGRPVSGGKARLIPVPILGFVGASGHFDVPIDADGWCDVSFIENIGIYTVTFADGKTSSGGFKAVDGGEIRTRD